MSARSSSSFRSVSPTATTSTTAATASTRAAMRRRARRARWASRRTPRSAGAGRDSSSPARTMAAFRSASGVDIDRFSYVGEPQLAREALPGVVQGVLGGPLTDTEQVRDLADRMVEEVVEDNHLALPPRQPQDGGAYGQH